MNMSKLNIKTPTKVYYQNPSRIVLQNAWEYNWKWQNAYLEVGHKITFKDNKGNIKTDEVVWFWENKQQITVMTDKFDNINPEQIIVIETKE